jgi:hypothetical protein
MSKKDIAIEELQSVIESMHDSYIKGNYISQDTKLNIMTKIRMAINTIKEMELAIDDHEPMFRFFRD